MPNGNGGGNGGLSLSIKGQPDHIDQMLGIMGVPLPLPEGDPAALNPMPAPGTLTAGGDWTPSRTAATTGQMPRPTAPLATMGAGGLSPAQLALGAGPDQPLAPSVAPAAGPPPALPGIPWTGTPATPTSEQALGQIPRTGQDTTAGGGPTKPPQTRGQKFLSALEKIGGIGLGAVAPGVAMQIPGTPLGQMAAKNREYAEMRMENQQQLEKAQAEEAEARTDLARTQADLAKTSTQVMVPGVGLMQVPNKELGGLLGRIATTEGGIQRANIAGQYGLEGREITGQYNLQGKQASLQKPQPVMGSVNGQPTRGYAIPGREGYFDAAGNQIPGFKIAPTMAQVLPSEVTPIQIEEGGVPVYGGVTRGGQLTNLRPPAGAAPATPGAPAPAAPIPAGIAEQSVKNASTTLERLRAPIDASAQRLSNIVTNQAFKTPTADSLLVPEFLIVTTGGQGSGVRLTDSEQNRIAGGATGWTQLVEAANKWSLDPKHPALTEEHRRQMREVIQAEQEKISGKQAIADQAGDALVASGDPKQHRQVINNVHKYYSAIDNGATARLGPDGVYLLKPGADQSKKENWQKLGF